MAAVATPPSFSVTSGQDKLENVAMKASNGDPLPDIGLLKPSTLDLPIEELRKRHEEDGYLWVSKLPTL